MDRCALFVDAGYVLGDGAMAVHGTRNRGSVSWDYSGVVQVLSNVARDRTGLPLLRCYWYEATVEGRRTPDHETLADLPGVKLRLGRMRPGRREGVESEIHRDLATLARNRAISDALVVSAEEDLAQVISDVQDLGIRVILAHIPVHGAWAVPAALRQECDDVVEISEAHLRPAVELVVGAEPVSEDDRHPVAAYAGRTPANGHGPTGALAHRQALPVGSHAAPPALYTGPVIAEYQRAAQPAIGQAAAASSAGPAASPASPAAAQQVPAAPGDAGRPGAMTAPAHPGPMAPQPGHPGAGIQPGPPPVPNGLPGHPGMPGQPAPPPQPGLSAPAGMPPGLAGQPGMQPGQPAGSGQPVNHVATTLPVPQGTPGLPPPGQAPPGQPGPRIGHHAAPGPPPDSPVPAGLPPVHGQHEFSPQQPALPAAAAMTQPYQTPAGVAGQQGSPLPPGLPPPGMAGQPGAAGYQAAPPAQAGPAPTGSRLSPGAPLGPAQPGPAGQPGSQGGLAPPRPYQAGPPARLPAGQQDQRSAPQFPPGHPDGGAPGPYVPQQGPHSGPQPAAQPAPVPPPVAVSLADAVQAAHGEGFSFGQVVARDAPALWLEAVLARKPRMPSDLEARLLQDSSLPIDSLLHDEVRHALRRGFWDALERVRH